ncbi:hypothetical protein TNCV_245141 [Trichonephila clavipes]|uniref:Uncharacterized protein n=1 Tax=Trichonephila clavipes TaxID=2585209 RepID=A0A8X6RPN2_TRICX|nr:hypothetical protein TNCV_245141 [Trichonephila clavipes]
MLPETAGHFPSAQHSLGNSLYTKLKFGERRTFSLEREGPLVYISDSKSGIYRLTGVRALDFRSEGLEPHDKQESNDGKGRALISEKGPPRDETPLADLESASLLCTMVVSTIVRVHYFVRGGFVRHRSRASSKHLSPHLPVGEVDSSGSNRGCPAPANARVGVGLQRNRPDIVVFEKCRYIILKSNPKVV